MSTRDVFALGKSDLNGFLFANVGTEVNGSPLTVLSTLARLGDDPWIKAASWARMSRAAAGAALAVSIGGMPLRPNDLEAAPSTAARLVDILFLSDVAKQQAQPPERAALRPVSVVLAYVVILVAFLLTMAAAHRVYSVAPTAAVTVSAARSPASIAP